MGDIVVALTVLAALLGVYMIILGGVPGRVGRPPRGWLTRQISPSDTPLGSAALGGLAIGSAVVALDPGADTPQGLTIGVVIGLALSFAVVRPVAGQLLSAIGFVLAVVAATRFVLGNDPGAVAAGDALAHTYRVALALLLFAAFCLGVLLRGPTAALRGGRGLALLALVDLCTFLAHPGHRDTLSLDTVGHLTYLGVVGGVAFAVGIFASEFVLGALALAVATVVWATDAVVGDALAAWVAVVAAGTAVTVILVAGRLGGSRPVGALR